MSWSSAAASTAPASPATCRAAARGCCCAKKDDLASHTSSSSTKLIHGGLRYLEYREFSLVRKALREREVLLKGAPHIMWPLRFVMPHDPSMRPVWMVRLGLFLYDHLARREVLPASRTVDLHRYVAGAPLKPQFTKGFVYSDGWVDDARLVALCALDAKERGATVLTRTACIEAQRGTADWRVTLKASDGTTREVRSRALVNAAGPWAAQFLMEHAHVADRIHLRLVKGSHIVVRKLFEHDHAYIFQNPDGRIIFAIPYERDFTLIGTTDIEHHGAIGEARAEPDEIAYLCDQASRYFAKPVTTDQVVWTYSGVRPLIDDESGNPAAVTRDYRLELDAGSADTPQAPLAVGLGRQDHDLSQARRRSGRPARAGARAQRRQAIVALTWRSARPGRTKGRCPAATCVPGSAPRRRRRTTSSPRSSASPRRWRSATRRSPHRSCTGWRALTARVPRRS